MLEAGADDYVKKPVIPRVLLARVRALLRRRDGSFHNRPEPEEDEKNSCLHFGKLEITKSSRRVSLQDKEIELSTKEFELLWYLAENAGKIISREILYPALKGYDYDGLDRSMDVTVSRLRKKMGDNTRSPFRIKQVNEYVTNLFKGPCYVMMKYLEHIAEDEIPDAIAALQKEFGFQLKAVKIKNPEFSASEIDALENGEILLHNQATIFYKRINHTHWAIAMGPIKDFEEATSLWQFKLAAWFTILSIIAVLSFIWIFPFWRNLKKIMNAAEHFGAGRFDARAEVGKRSLLRTLAEAFNNMAEKTADLIQSQKLLVNAVSHEFRTPVSRVRFRLGMLENSVNKQDWKRYITGISEDIDDLESLVSELLTYASFDQKAEYIHFEIIHIGNWLVDIVKKLSPFTAGKKVVLDLEKAPEELTGDSRFLGRALENLILNGIKYANSQVIIKAEKKRGETVISVSDDGPGIPDEYLAKVFEPFVRLDKSRNRDTGGYGLGLAIVKQIVERHGGEVSAQQSKFVPPELPGNSTKYRALFFKGRAQKDRFNW